GRVRATGGASEWSSGVVAAELDVVLQAGGDIGASGTFLKTDATTLAAAGDNVYVNEVDTNSADGLVVGKLTSGSDAATVTGVQESGRAACRGRGGGVVGGGRVG